MSQTRPPRAFEFAKAPGWFLGLLWKFRRRARDKQEPRLQFDRSEGNTALPKSSLPEDNKKPVQTLAKGKKCQLSRLEMLPRELITIIANTADRADKICLALASRTLMGVIGTDSWPLRKHRTLRIQVLFRVARDLPDMFCCYHCSKLHMRNLVSPPTKPPLGGHYECPEISGCEARDIPGEITSPLLAIYRPGGVYLFRMCHLTLAMKRHHQGPQHGISLDTLSYTEVSAVDAFFTTLTSIHARICPNGQRKSTLILQVQDWVLIHDDVSGVNEFEPIVQYKRICHHRCRLSLKEIIPLTVRARGFGTTQGEDLEDRMCPECGVQFRIDLRDCGGEGRAVVITKWLDLGSGHACEDLRLRALVNNNVITRDRRAIPSKGQIRQRYEAQGNDLTERNYLYLAKRRYRDALVKSSTGRGIWESNV
ncbi:hypothetical protein BJX64DRAFT_291158 [Aspergillus heterothallicus]